MPAPDNTITDPRFTMCQTVLKRAEAGEIEIATSAFTLAEVCKRRDEAPQNINLPAFFDQPYILLVPVEKRIGLRAQHLQLSGVGNIKPADAIHLASALVADVPVFHTFDGGLLGLDKVLTLNDGKQLQIVKPTGETPLPGLLAGMQNGIH
jgi:predicted nucleic acid-binding protein